MLLFPAATLFLCVQVPAKCQCIFSSLLFFLSKTNSSVRSAGSPEGQRDLHASRWPGRVAMWYGVGDVLVVVWRSW